LSAVTVTPLALRLPLSVFLCVILYVSSLLHLSVLFDDRIGSIALMIIIHMLMMSTRQISIVRRSSFRRINALSDDSYYSSVSFILPSCV